MTVNNIYRGIPGDSSAQFNIGDAFTTAQNNDDSLNASKPENVNSVAALRLLDKTKISSAETKGYYTAGDGGHGKYWYDASDTTSADDGGSVIVGADGARWKLHPVNGVVNVLQFGGDIQGAVNSGAGEVHLPAADFTITDTITVSLNNVDITLASGCSLTLVTTDVDANVFNVSGSGVEITGGNITTTLRTLKFLVNLSGENSALVGCDISFATKSTIAPIGAGNDIPYNRGGVSLRGVGTSCRGCQIYHQEGAGVVTYGTGHSVVGNAIHDNVLGVHASVQAGETTSRTVLISDNNIYNNNVNHASGAVGILSVGLTNIIVSGNRITGNGEHGTYIYSEKSTISNNYVSGNYRNGLKVRAAREVTLSSNVVVDNNTEDAGAQGSIVIQSQLSAGLDPENNKVIVSGNISNGSNCIGIITSFVSSGHVVKNLIFTENITNSMQIAADSDVIVANNIVSGVIDIGAGFANAPAIQLGFKVHDNIADTINMNRCANSYIESNTIRTLTTGSQGENVIKGNSITAQATQITRTSFLVFTGNNVGCAALGALPLLLQGGSSATNSYKQITNNTFTAHVSRIIDDSTSVISGDKNIISGNSFDSTTDGVSLWGEGHTIMNNVNINSGGVGFVGCNNSWLIGNSPKIAERPGTVGNQNI